MSDVEEVMPEKKKPKLESTEKAIRIHDSLPNLVDFIPEEVLSLDTRRKSVNLKGHFKGLPGTGIILLEKNAFTAASFLESRDFFSPECYLKQEFSNDIYGNYLFYPKVELNDNNAEADRIVYRDKDPKHGFVLLPDLKWDGKTSSTLYLLAIAENRNIKSLRDLTEDHLELLRNIQDKGIEEIKKKYGLDKSELRVYIHYQPSFYHLHVHFTHISHEAPGIHAEKSHMLANVISNIELLPDYYQKTVLPFVVFENSNLYRCLVDKNIFSSKDKNKESKNV